MSRFSVSNLLARNRSKKSKHAGTSETGSPLAVDRGAASPQKASTPSKLSMVIAAQFPLAESSRAGSIVEVRSSDNESLSSFYDTPLAENIPSRPSDVNLREADGKDGGDEHALAKLPDSSGKRSEEWEKLDMDGRNSNNATTAAVADVVDEERRRSAAELAAIHQECEKQIGLREEERNQAQERLRDAESELRTAQEEIRTKSKKINIFRDDMENLTALVNSLEEEKREVQIRLESERTTSQMEVARLSNIAELERESHERVVAEMSAKIAELSTQAHEQQSRISKLEECLTDSQTGVDESEARIDRLEIHLYDSQVRVDEQQETIKQLESEVRENRKIVKKQETLISRLEAENGEHQAKINDQESRIHLLEAQLSETKAEVINLHAHNCDLETRLLHREESASSAKEEELTKDIQITILEQSQLGIAAQLIDVQSSLTSMERQNRMLMDQIRQQSSEMAASKGLRRPPSASSDKMARGAGADRLDSAVRVIRMLNDEIFQTAASMTDQLESISRGMAVRFVAGDCQRSALAANLKSMLGTELVNDLSSRRSVLADDSTMFLMRVQTALQGCLIACSMRIITSWYPTEWEYGTFLVALFERIRGTDGLEKAIQWRKTALKGCIPPTNLNEKLVTLFITEINKILSLCGWDVKEKKTSELLSRFIPKLSEIATLAARVNNWASAGNLGEAECISVEAGTMYDPSRMANDDDLRVMSKRRVVRNAPPSEQVICTIGLGIEHCKHLDEDGSHLLLKPKVVLYGSLF